MNQNKISNDVKIVDKGKEVSNEIDKDKLERLNELIEMLVQRKYKRIFYKVERIVKYEEEVKRQTLLKTESILEGIEKFNQTKKDIYNDIRRDILPHDVEKITINLAERQIGNAPIPIIKKEIIDVNEVKVCQQHHRIHQKYFRK